MSDNPLAEVFGFPTDNHSPAASRSRKSKLCPFNNKVPNCTKDKALAPLGVCSIYEEGDGATIICPTRFHENWLIAEDAAEFFFPSTAAWTSLTEVRLKDANGQSAGNIDVVLVSYDENGKLLDFGSLEIQAVYISGNIRNPFEHYMENPEANANKPWTGVNFPRPDYLSSSRKRLVPQMLYKGGIFNDWKKKQAVAIHKSFYATLPELPEVSREEADIAWLLYDLKKNEEDNRFEMVRHRTIYTAFDHALLKITKAPAGKITDFVKLLQTKLDEQLSLAPDAPTLQDMLSRGY